MTMTKWSNKIPEKGDWIRSKINGYYHHGVFLNENEVIHYCSEQGFSILNRNMEVRKTGIDVFSQNNIIEVRSFDGENEKINDQQKVCTRADSMIGEKKYDFFYNNCEHMTNDCFFNKRESEYIDGLIRKGLKVRRHSGISGIIDEFYVNLVKLNGRI